jgi:iron complex outermembrane receptor protein
MQRCLRHSAAGGAVLRAVVLSAALWVAPSVPLAAEAAPQRIVVTASPAARTAAEAPYAITVVDAEALRAAGPMVHLSEALARVPGIVANNRGNYAQDLQLSARGFGARAGFGVRGLRLYSDGIPATMPDGQGQVAHFDLAGADRVEVLRGPFSVLYGNSSGGVLAVFSAPVREQQLGLGLDLGSGGLRQWRAALAQPLGPAEAAGQLGLRAGVSHLDVRGFRPHSQAQRTLAHAALDWRGRQTGAQDRVVLQGSAFDQPAQDPLGLSAAQFAADPFQTTPQAPQFDTRKTARQQQLGAAWTRRPDRGALRETQLAVYTGRREVVQWLAIAPATQANPGHGGGVIDLDRRYHGLDARARFALGAVDLVAGLAAETQDDARRGFENFRGSGAAAVLGVTGALRRDERNRATTRDAYLQAELPLPADLLLAAGLRSGRVVLQADDRFLSNGDDSGRLQFGYTNPVLGLRWSAAPGLVLFAGAARGFESPTLGELAYRPDGVGGFNTGLQPQRSRQLEAGLKWQQGRQALELTVFDVQVQDEIGVATNAGGRSSFQNVGATRRRGLELAGSAALGGPWHTQVVASTLDARYRDGFLACAGLPCAAPSVPVPAGHRVAGTRRASLWAELAWRQAQRELGLEARAATRTTANDANTAAAPGHGTLALRWTERLALSAGWHTELLVRVDNLGDRRHAASLIVNDANGRFFEPAPPRSLLVALRVQGRP